MNIKFDAKTGLIPAIIQNDRTKTVLMLGYMNKEALDKTIQENMVTFYSRSKMRLWTKGETSGNSLYVKSMKVDCDNDTLLIRVNPVGPTCHTGSNTCFQEDESSGFIYQLEQTISERINSSDSTSYSKSLFQSGINKVAQKVGEEAVELVIEAKDNNDDLFLNEAADLMYHFLLLLKAKGFKMDDVENILRKRSKNKKASN